MNWKSKNSTRLKGRSRTISRENEKLLYVRAGGRCERPDCYQYLLADPLTRRPSNIAQGAHIKAHSSKGPRGAESQRGKHWVIDGANANSVENLLLLCYPHHREIDKDAKNAHKRYPVHVLKEWKRLHEERVYKMTGYLSARRFTTIFRLNGAIRGDFVPMEDGQLHEAISPKFSEEMSFGGGLANLAWQDTPEFIKSTEQQIATEIKAVTAHFSSRAQRGHLSVFAVAPLPALIYLGSRLSDKGPVDFYHFTRGTKDWRWKQGPGSVRYRSQQLQSGSSSDEVALVLSLSGSIPLEDLPKSIDGKFSIYEITLKNEDPNRMFLKTRRDLERFREAYAIALGKIRRLHKPKTIHLFIAAPPVVAMACGHDLLATDAPLTVYDFKDGDGKYHVKTKIKKQ